MKKIKILAASFLMFGSVSGFGQKIIEHKVGTGDTITSIARKYNVSVSDIYRLNPDAIQGVKIDAIIKVPSATTQTSVKKHIVSNKDTVYSIARQYDVKPAEIELANKEVLKDVLKPGMVLVIPSKGVTIPTVSSSNIISSPARITNIYHTVSPKETKFGIAKQYGLTIEELENLNTEIKGNDNVEIGVVLRLTDSVPSYGSITSKDYVIQPQETLYSLSKKAGLTEEEFLKMNPILRDGVLSGITIKMPNNLVRLDKPISNLSENLNKKFTKNLVLLLPFNTDKIGLKKEVTIQDQLKNDRFLNMTLDFYAGALVAIDSAKKLGLPIKVQVLDSKENKASSDINSLYAKGSFDKSDAIIGPFFQNHVETLAEKLASQQTPIISPMSNEKGKAINNLYQSMPSSEDVKKKMIDYIYASNGNIIAIIDPKKGSSKKYITESFPTVKMVSMLETGLVNTTQLKQVLEKNRTNFVILDTESINLVVNTTKALTSNSNEYPIQLVTLDKNETLESDEISLDDLMKLKLLYPSVTRDTNEIAQSSFVKSYKAYNGIAPNKFATRGFDITFDTILRLFNQDGFKTAVENLASEQIENKFNYINVDGAYYNKGVYLMYYDLDLTVKEVN